MDLRTLRYSSEKLWVRLDNDNHVTVGLTDEALEDCDELTKLRLPSEGDEFSKDEPFGRLAVGSGAGLRLLAPLSGEIIAINEDIADAPEVIQEDPYEEGWLIQMEASAMHEYDDLMTKEEFDEFVSDDMVDDSLDGDYSGDEEDEDDDLEEDDEDEDYDDDDYYDY